MRRNKGRGWCGIVVLAAIMSPTMHAAEPVSAPVKPASKDAASSPQKRSSGAPGTITGAGLRNRSQQAFSRGLLPLTDHLEHLAAAEEADLRRVMTTSSADTAPSSAALLSALQPRVNALRSAVRQLEAFRQPAAANWQADLLLSKYVLAQAEEETSLIAGDIPAADHAGRTQSRVAIEHYQQRLFDARVLGHASLSEVTRAVSFLNIDPTRKRQALVHAVGATQRWNAVSSGIGRTDRVLDAQLQVALWDAEPRPAKTDETAIRQGLIDADQLSSRLFATQRQYFAHGTATLADLSRAWQTRRQVHLLADMVQTTLPTTGRVSYERDLKELTHLAAAARDERGRNASDLEYVRLLQNLHVGDRIGQKAVP